MLSSRKPAILRAVSRTRRRLQQQPSAPSHHLAAFAVSGTVSRPTKCSNTSMGNHQLQIKSIPKYFHCTQASFTDLGSSERLVGGDPHRTSYFSAQVSTLQKSTRMSASTASLLEVQQTAIPISMQEFLDDLRNWDASCDASPGSHRQVALYSRNSFSAPLPNIRAYRYGSYNSQQRKFAPTMQTAFFSTQPQEKNKDDPSNYPSELSTGTQDEPKRRVPSSVLGTTRVPTPQSAPAPEKSMLQRLAETSPSRVMKQGSDLVISACTAMVRFLLLLPSNTFYYATHPAEVREAYARFKDAVKHEIDHYWNGTKLLWADVQTARGLLYKTLHGSFLTRRERKQLLRTVSDLFRLVPFSMFIIIPLGELALPFVLRIFPNLLPSTFQDSLKNEENMKRELQSRIAMAQFFGEYVYVLLR